MCAFLILSAFELETITLRGSVASHLYNWTTPTDIVFIATTEGQGIPSSFPLGLTLLIPFFCFVHDQLTGYSSVQEPFALVQELLKMKFGKQIQRRQLDLPEYAASFVNYKALKKLIKQLSATPKLPAQATVAGEGAPDAQAALRANKEVFFFRLEREIEKVNTFYLQKESEFSLRLKTLLDKKRVVQSRAVSHSKAPANFVALIEGFQQFDGDLNKLQQFVAINETAMSKILKKVRHSNHA
ncbi:phosphate system positive regulatory protein pho81 [Aspergillus fumigatus]